MASTPRDWFGEKERIGDSREDAFVLRNYSSSLMSNTKWRKLIEAIDQPNISVTFCMMKFVWSGVEKSMFMPKTRDIRTPSYIDSEFGPLRFKAIEWLEIPRSTIRYCYEGDPGQEVHQDAMLARRALEIVGQYPIEDTERGFRIIGHVPRSAGGDHEPG